MQNNIENNEITLDLDKILKIIWYRKFWIICCFTIAIVFAVILTNIEPKKYESGAKILINKTNSTNMAEINPFILSDGNSNAVSSLFSSGSNLGDELEIIQSPLVLDAVIKVNNLKYTEGLKKGEYLSVDDFLKSNISIENAKSTSVITIKYKSIDPKVAYNVVNSIINNYKEIYENINNKKALKDKNLIYKSYDNAKAELDRKVQELRQFKSASSANSDSAGSTPFNLLGFYDKRINQKLNKMSVDSVEVQRLEREIDQISEKVKMLSSRLEWSSLVENISKEASKVVVLKEPELRNSFDFSEPNLIINLVLAVAFSIFLSVITVILIEITDKRLSYSDLDEKNFYIKNRKEFRTVDFMKLQAGVVSKNIKSLLLVSFLDKDITDNFANLINNNLGLFNLKVSVLDTALKEQLPMIENFDNILILSKIGYTDKRLYKEFNNIFCELNKNILVNYVIR